MSTKQDQLLEQYAGKVVPFTFNAGFVCLSYAISLIGTGTTLELIRRRTSHRGLHNLLLLVGAAISMGGIAIWSMHFIGNRAIYMLDGQEEFQIAYSTALTVMSLLVPILVLALAFVAVTGNGRIMWWRICIAGLLSGGAICGMHYLADASISNYSSSYKLANLIGSVVIAASASTAALAVFFVFEAAWKSVWWKRLGCAMILAGAVSGMHWCAAVGTSYKLQKLSSSGKGVSRQDAMIVVICLSIFAGLVMTGLAVYSSWVRRDYASKSQQVVLAAGVFDDKGRIMVSQDGYLPSEVVTDTYLPKSNDDIFGTGHPLFHWMFRASRNWGTISAVTSKMANHISVLAQERNNGRAGVRLVGDDGVLVEDYDIILRELFCLAATALASKTRETLANVGTLWDDIFVTGESSKPLSPAKDKLGFAEKGFQSAHMQNYGRGCLMFLVRQVESKREIDRLEAAGFRFADVRQVVGNIRSGMQIKTPDLEARLRNMSIQKNKTTMMSPGVHIGMFAVRARLDRSGFDVLAQKRAKNLLPTIQLSTEELGPAEIMVLEGLRGMSLSAIMSRLDTTRKASPKESLFAADLMEAMINLRESLADATFDDATLLPRGVQLPCAAPERASGLSKCTLVAFRLVLPIHANVDCHHCEFTPLNFFKLRQLTYENSPHHLEFSHMVHRDMSSGVHNVSTRRYSSAGPHTVNATRPGTSRFKDKVLGRKHGRKSGLPVLTKSQEELASNPAFSYNQADDISFESIRKMSSGTIASAPKELEGDGPKSPSSHHVFGGIMVSQEVSINVQEDVDTSGQSGAEMAVLTPRSETHKNGYTATATGTGDKFRPLSGKQQEAAFVDELLTLAMQADGRSW